MAHYYSPGPPHDYANGNGPCTRCNALAGSSRHCGTVRRERPDPPPADEPVRADAVGVESTEE